MNYSIQSDQLQQILHSSLQSVDPINLIRQQIRRIDDRLILPDGYEIDLDMYERVFLCGAGKGAAPMTRAVEDLLDERLVKGNIIVKYGHLDSLRKTQIFEAGHPVPDQNTIQATDQILNDLRNLSKSDCVFVLLTGGGSALLESLPVEITLEDLQVLNKILLSCGATIHEINCVRKHISKVKGGQLARYIYPANCITLVLSDVIGDNLSVIASGPTSPDNSTFDDALSIFHKYAIENDIPSSIFSYIKDGASGHVSETPKFGDTIFDNVHNLVIGNNRLALATAREKAESLGYHTLILTTTLQGEAKEIAQVLAAIIREIQDTNTPIKKPACLLLGGEPTVHIKGKGKGGRNQELCLALTLAAIEKPYVFFSCGTDGTDGPTDAAGAIVSNETLAKSEKIGLKAIEYLRNNDSYNFFNPLGDLIKTGPTKTNVMDILCALIPE